MLVIDIQGFMCPNFVPKELSASDGERTCHFVFKPPFPWRCLASHLKPSVLHLTREKHGLCWNSGIVDLNQADVILEKVTRRESAVYVKGKVKADYLRAHINVPVVDLDATDCPPLPTWKPPCFFHVLNTCSCTANNVNFILQYLTNKNYQQY